MGSSELRSVVHTPDRKDAYCQAKQAEAPSSARSLCDVYLDADSCWERPQLPKSAGSICQLETKDSSQEEQQQSQGRTVQEPREARLERAKAGATMVGD